MDFRGYLKKEFNVKFFKFFNLEVVAENREDGTYKHFVSVFFLNKKIVEVIFRTGVRKENHIFVPHFYMGTITKGDKYFYFEEGIINTNEGNVWRFYKSNFKDCNMNLTVEDKNLSRKVNEYYMRKGN